MHEIFYSQHERPQEKCGRSAASEGRCILQAALQCVNLTQLVLQGVAVPRCALQFPFFLAVQAHCPFENQKV